MKRTGVPEGRRIPIGCILLLNKKAASPWRMRPLCCLLTPSYLILMKMMAKVNRVSDSMKARPRIINS